jgi:hypothetical protein
MPTIPVATRAATSALAVLALAATLTACKAAPVPAAVPPEVRVPTATPTPTPTTPGRATAAPTTTPPTRATAPTLRPLGDLTIHLAGGCVEYQDSGGGLWLNPTMAAVWTGPAPFPANAVAMTANPSGSEAGGPVTSAAPFTRAIGGQPVKNNAMLGHTVTLTVTIDPVNTVPETNEANNVTTISVVVPSTPPPASGAEQTVRCF